ncbi:hypothetical protein [Oscillatoria sp. FACHB-1406]|uniref:hypothetical protein n=1 Tax=Oscillatoria sp. FACHB-1406 TaxID=2692846 RepID=UPI00168557FC|nr:hypothetical protein [Oscillatoria sp. FACHB-1406]MBD2576938.1 hypothetical protein [Oscillatoria sp. FACHB-1406]
MSEDKRSRMTKWWHRGTFVFMVLSLIISALLLVLFIFGIPGTQNDYARGWNLGFTTLYWYCIGCLSLLGINGISALILKGFFPTVRRVTMFVFWLFFGYSAFNFCRAFLIIFSAS